MTEAGEIPPPGTVEAIRAPFGVMPDGTPVEAVMLRAANGVSARIITLGATLQALYAPDRHGIAADITLGHDEISGFVSRHEYWGQTIGRYANRIAGGRFVLDGREYRLPVNNGPNTLHGGPEGFDRRLWRIERVTSGAIASVVLTLISPDGDQGFPGALDVTVTYTLDNHGLLTIAFAATSDAPTIVNLTNHAVFNLAGEASGNGIYGHRVTIRASRFTPVYGHQIPTGELRATEGSIFDFRTGRLLSDGIRDGREAQIAIGRGWDHNFVLDKGPTELPERAARVEDPQSGRVLEVLTTEPGIQLYTGNFIDGSRAGKSGRLYRMGDGLALEPQKFPDTPNHPEFGSARVAPDDPYRHVMAYRLSVMD